MLLQLQGSATQEGAAGTMASDSGRAGGREVPAEKTPFPGNV